MTKISLLLFLFILNLYINPYISLPIPLPRYGPVTSAKDNQYKKDPLVQNLTQCARQTKSTIKEIGNYVRRTKQTKSQGRCLTACMLKKVNVIRNNRLSQHDALAHYSYAEGTQMMAKLKSVLDDCTKEAEIIPDECGLAAKFMDCMNKKFGKSQDEDNKKYVDTWDIRLIATEEENMIRYISQRL